MKFSIRDLLLVTVIVALAVGWWVDRSRLAAEMSRLAEENASQYKRIYDLTMYAKQRHPQQSDLFPPWGDELPNSSAPAPNPPKD